MLYRTKPFNYYFGKKGGVGGGRRRKVRILPCRSFSFSHLIVKFLFCFPFTDLDFSKGVKFSLNLIYKMDLQYSFRWWELNWTGSWDQELESWLMSVFSLFSFSTIVLSVLVAASYWLTSEVYLIHTWNPEFCQHLELLVWFLHMKHFLRGCFHSELELQCWYLLSHPAPLRLQGNNNTEAGRLSSSLFPTPILLLLKCLFDLSFLFHCNW